MMNFYSIALMLMLSLSVAFTSAKHNVNKHRKSVAKHDLKVNPCKLCNSNCKEKEGLSHVPAKMIDGQYVPAADIFYKMKGNFNAQKPTLVFLHFLEGAHTAWACQQEEFCEKYCTLSVDLRGRGKSSHTDPSTFDYTNAALAGDLHRVLINLGITGPIVLVGSVSGGFVALKYIELYSTISSALYDKKRTVSKLVLINSGPGLTTAPDCATASNCVADGTTCCITSTLCPDCDTMTGTCCGPACCLCFPYANVTCSGFNLYIKPALNSNYPITGCTFSESVFPESCVNQVAQAKLRFVQDWLDTTPAIQENLYINALAEDLRSVLPTITIPTMICYGTLSPTPAGASLYLHNNIVSSFIVKFVNKGEQPQITDYKNFNKIFSDFLTDVRFADSIDIINPDCCVCPLYKPTKNIVCPAIPDLTFKKFFQKR